MSIVSADLCVCCGEPESVELVEFWAGGEFQLSTCCEGLHEALIERMNEDDRFRVQLLRELGVEDYVRGTELRRVPDCDGQFLLDFNLFIREITLAEARAFVAEHHKHNAASVGWRFGAGIWNGPMLIGVAMVGRPVARLIDARSTVEVNRLCVRRDIPSPLVWNACSQLYGWCAREARRSGFKKIITYTLETEAGTTLKAAGWTREARTKGGSWNRPGRPRVDKAPICRKFRWARQFEQRAAA